MSNYLAIVERMARVDRQHRTSTVQGIERAIAEDPYEHGRYGALGDALQDAEAPEDEVNFHYDLAKRLREAGPNKPSEIGDLVGRAAAGDNTSLSAIAAILNAEGHPFADYVKLAGQGYGEGDHERQSILSRLNAAEYGAGPTYLPRHTMHFGRSYGPNRFPDDRNFYAEMNRFPDDRNYLKIVAMPHLQGVRSGGLGYIPMPVHEGTRSFMIPVDRREMESFAESMEPYGEPEWREILHAHPPLWRFHNGYDPPTYQGLNPHEVFHERLKAAGIDPSLSHEQHLANRPDRQQEKPEQYAAWRAPAGGMVVRGSFYEGGKMIPSLEGEFMKQPDRKSKIERAKKALKAAKEKREGKPLIVSYGE